MNHNQAERLVLRAADMRVEPDCEKPDKFVEAMSKMVMHQPFFTVLLMDMLQIKFTRSVDTMGTDGKWLYVNPDFCEDLSADEIMFVIAHEVMHVILQHFPRSMAYKAMGFGPDMKPFDFGKMNKAQDYIINDHLIRAGCGTMPNKGGKIIGLHDTSIATMEDLMDDVYRSMPDEDGDGGDGGDSGGGHGGFDQHIEPTPDDQPMSDAQLKQSVASAANAAKAQGKLPANLERLAGEIIEPKKDWKELLRDAMTTCIGTDENTWAKPHRRRLATQGVYYPGTRGFAAGYVVIQIDTSGSVSEKELTAFRSEVSGILSDAKPEGVKILWVDARVAGVDDVMYPEEIETLTPKGGGGTDMRAGVQWCIDNDVTPSTFVCLTDGYTPWPDDAPFNTIWCITEESQVEDCPVGQAIHLDVSGD